MAGIEHICLLLDGDSLYGVRTAAGVSAAIEDVKHWRFSVTKSPPNESDLGGGVVRLSLGEAFAAAGKELDIDDGCVLVLPSDVLIAKVLSLPALDGESLASTVRLQMEKLAPVAGDDLAVAWETLAATEESVRVFAVAIPLATLEIYASALSEASLRVWRIDSSILCQWAHYSAGANLDFSNGSTSAKAFLFALPSGGFDILIADASGLLFARSLGVARLAEDVVREMTLSFLDFGAENPSLSIDSLTCVSSSPLDPALLEALPAASGLSAIQVETTLEGSYILGAARRAEESGVLDIIPAAWRRLEHAAASRGRFYKGMAAALALWVLLAAAYVAVPIYFKRRLAAVEAKIAALQPRCEQVTDLRAKVRIIASYEDRSRSFLEVLRGVCDKMPSGIIFSSLTYDKGGDVGGGMRITGDAEQSGAVLLFKDALDKSGVFEAVKLSGPTLDSKRQRYRFEIDAQFVASEVSR